VGDAAAPTVPRLQALVGRYAEFAFVEAFSARLAEGARGVVVRGEPGIGKTALWHEGLAFLRGAGHTVLICRPAEEEMSLAAGGLADLLEGTTGDPAAVRAIDDPLVRGRMVLETLRALAREGPVVVAIDDAQWLDSVSARAIRYALRRLDLEPVGLLTTVRSGAEWPDALRAQSALPPGRCDVVELGPLSLGALRRVLGGVVDAISRPALARIHAASGGNPLYAIELARAGWGSASAALPDSLREVLDRRLDLAPSDLLPLLEAVSALGPTSVMELRRLFPDVSLDVLLGATESQGLLLVENDLSVRFVHPLIGSAVYARMSPLARRALHGRLAAISVEPELRARHLALSTDDPDLAVADELEAAAVRARGRGAPDVAADFAGHSLRLTPPEAELHRRRREHLEIEQLAAAGEVRHALDRADRLVASLSPGPDRVEALVQRADLEDDDRETAERLLLGALDESQGDERLRGRVLHRLAQLRRLRIGDIPGAIECAREALALAESVGDPTLEASAAAYFAHLEALAGRPQPALIERAVRLEEEVGGLPLSVGPRSLLAKQRLWAGNLDDARELLELVHRDALRAGNQMKLPQHSYDLTLVECAAGNLDAAARAVHEGIEAAIDAENTYTERELLYPLALVQALTGRADDARDTVARLRDEAVLHGVRPLLVRAAGVLGMLELSEGKIAAAVEPLTEATRALDEMGFAHPGAFPVLCDTIEALARSGHHDAARELLEVLERQAEAVSSASARAGAMRASGIVLLAAGDADASASVLADAAERFGRLGFRIDGARTELCRGRALVRAGRRARAAEVLATVRARFADLHAPLWEARAAEELGRAAPGSVDGELTRTESNVARLVAEGRRNREIASALFMSVHTVEAHLTRIYRKLGIRSRSDLTRLVLDGAVTLSDEEPS
jgi:DNA-binding CsgD family transcriptional regulator